MGRTTLAPRMLLLAEIAIWTLLLMSHRRADENRGGPVGRLSAPVDEERVLREPVLPASPR